ncbi:glycoside hydrolase family 9 protein [Haloferula sp. BvORR071]|uniref:glycoside hydrolase family 9 protein n=1 Tax=Haloferula sp. BvORR071 TaxID=1396141 RepID=UPI002240E8A0|nr:glycoside hydrolase family 9 protein [Haloferula sp. BvORR071]
MVSGSLSHAQADPGEYGSYPLEAAEENSLMARWEKKPVLESRVIDDMEGAGGWKVNGIGEMGYTEDRARDGKQSLRFSTSVRDAAYLALPGNKSEWGSQTFSISGQAGASSVQLRFDKPQDWSAYNRISYWVYVHPTSMPRHNLNLEIKNEGGDGGALSSARSHYSNDLKPGMWNHVLFEMPHLQRDKVTMFSLTRELTGNNPGEDPIVTYDIDRLELQRVPADAYEGWAVSAGKFAFSHAGYRPEDPKIAMVGGGGGERFELVDQAGRVVLAGDVGILENKNGVFHQVDFSGFHTEGVYRIRCGPLVSDPFPIHGNIWLQPVFKAVNFYYCERCGYEVPGIHKECHKDWQGFRGDEKKVINGGWHDAGDLSQGIWRSSMAIYAMLCNLEAMQQNKGASAVRARMLSEVAWGLKYLLKTRFGDGYHIHWCRMRMFTDNEIGTVDDVVVPAQNVAWENFLAAAVESKAAMLLEGADPELAAQARAAAIDDWQAAVASRGTWDQASIEEAAWGVSSSLLMARMSGEEKYRKQAVVLGDLLLRCQEQSFVEGIPITGYFYQDTERRRVIHNKHTAFDEAPMIALAMLCKELPQHEKWMAWYSSAVLYSEFFMKRGSQIAAPYQLLPNSVWNRAEVLADKDKKHGATSLQQFNEGTRLNDDHVLRTFPIWTDSLFHGNTNIQLSSTWALAEAARLRNDAEGMKLVGKQLEWVLGANPFGQSLMYGEGYDFAPQFAYCLKDIVGSLPVGMDCRSGDQPYWPATVSATFKEMWMEPVSRFLGAVSVYASPIPQESGKDLDMQVKATQSAQGVVNLDLSIRGSGKHEIELRTFNARSEFTRKQVDLSASGEGKLQFELKVPDVNRPYVAVISVDGNPELRREVVGSYSDASILSGKPGRAVCSLRPWSLLEEFSRLN